MNKAQFWNIENVSTFQGFDVINGEVSLSNCEYRDHLDEIYGDIEVCGMTYGAGNILEGVDPVAFRCGKSDYESQLQSELEEQLEREDSDNIEFINGDEDNEDFDYGYEAFEAGEPCNESESDDWVAGWIDAESNKKHIDEYPLE